MIPSASQCRVPLGALCAVLWGSSSLTAAPDLVIDTGEVRFERILSGPATQHDPAFSPDGRHIAFVSTESGSRRVWVMDADGSAPRQLTFDPPEPPPAGQSIDDFYPAWFPDGRRLAFASDRGGDSTRVWSVPLEGGEPEPLTPGHSGFPGQSGFSLSPDGTRLAYAGHTADGGYDIFVRNLAGGAAVRLTDHPGWDMHPAYSPDGRWIAFSSSRSDTMQIWVVPAEGGEPRVLTPGYRAFWMSWSPDGRWIAAQDVAGDARRNQVFLVPASGGERIELTTPDSLNGWVPRWSPDGRRLAMTGSIRSSQVEVLDLATDSVTVVATSGEPRASASWSRDDAWIAYHPDDDRIAVVSSAGGSSRVLGGGPGDRWTGPSWSPDGETIAFTRRQGPAARGSGQIWSVAVDGGEPEPLTLQDAWLAAHSPDGAWIGYAARGGEPATFDVWVIPAVGGRPQQVSSGAGHDLLRGWSGDGAELFVFSALETGQFWASFVRALPLAGGPPRVLHDFGVVDLYAGLPEVSPDGDYLLYAGVAPQSEGRNEPADMSTYLLSLRDGSRRRLSEEPLRGARFSHDGGRIAYYRDLIAANEDIWLVDLTRLLDRLP